MCMMDLMSWTCVWCVMVFDVLDGFDDLVCMMCSYDGCDEFEMFLI